MSALIKCEILGGTEIGDAYDDCRRIGRATGTYVECVFNGVAMFWSRHTTKDDWMATFYRKIGRDSSSSSSARPGSGRRPRESLSLTARHAAWKEAAREPQPHGKIRRMEGGAK